jgi:cytoskeletal protein RodZ
VPDYGEIDRKRGELSNLRRIPIDQLEEYEKWFAGQSFGDSTRAQQYQRICQAVLDSLRTEIDRQRREETEDRKDRESRRKDLPWKIAGVAIAIVAVLISAVVAIHNIFFSKTQHANTGAATQPTYRQTPMPTAGSPILETGSSSATPSPQQTATAQPSTTMTAPSSNPKN